MKNQKTKKLEQIVVMADQHIPFLSKRMERITLDYTKDNSLDIGKFVFLGDGCDNPGMSKFPQRAEDNQTLQEEIDAYITHINKYVEIVPDAEVVLIAGNHDKGRYDMVRSLNKNMASLRATEFENLLKESILNAGYHWDFSLHDVYTFEDVTFTHGDPRIDPYIKGGATGARRTAEMYPELGDIVMGHKHQVITYPRTKGDHSLYVVGAMFDIDEVAEQYKSYHGYQNGFLVITDEGKVKQFDNIEVKEKPLLIDGVEYN